MIGFMIMVMVMLMVIFMFMVMLMLIFILRAMVSHIIEVLSVWWSGVLSGHGLAQGLVRD